MGMSASIAYQCYSCGAITQRSQLKTGAWGDVCCPACDSPDLSRYRTRFDRWYAIFFLFKVY
jgi:DNA-directed RNA polymerase subunit RPC12/RpoP